jgi:activator of Hsp90 ATPase-like protein
MTYDLSVDQTYDRPGFETTVELTFGAEGARTHVTLAQRGFPTQAERDDFAGAWPDVLELLRDYVR